MFVLLWYDDYTNLCPKLLVIALIFGKSGAWPSTLVLYLYHKCYCGEDHVCPETFVIALMFGESGALLSTLVLYLHY